MDFRVGDKVVLQKGGPIMTVEYVKGSNINEDMEFKAKLSYGDVLCTWFDDKDKMHQEWLKFDEIEIYRGY